MNVSSPYVPQVNVEQLRHTRRATLAPRKLAGTAMQVERRTGIDGNIRAGFAAGQLNSIRADAAARTIPTGHTQPQPERFTFGAGGQRLGRGPPEGAPPPLQRPGPTAVEQIYNLGSGSTYQSANLHQPATGRDPSAFETHMRAPRVPEPSPVFAAENRTYQMGGQKGTSRAQSTFEARNVEMMERDPMIQYKGNLNPVQRREWERARPQSRSQQMSSIPEAMRSGGARMGETTRHIENAALMRMRDQLAEFQRMRSAHRGHPNKQSIQLDAQIGNLQNEISRSSSAIRTTPVVQPVGQTSRSSSLVRRGASASLERQVSHLPPRTTPMRNVLPSLSAETPVPVQSQHPATMSMDAAPAPATGTHAEQMHVDTVSNAVQQHMNAHTSTSVTRNDHKDVVHLAAKLVKDAMAPPSKRRRAYVPDVTTGRMRSRSIVTQSETQEERDSAIIESAVATAEDRHHVGLHIDMGRLVEDARGKMGDASRNLRTASAAGRAHVPVGFKPAKYGQGKARKPGTHLKQLYDKLPQPPLLAPTALSKEWGNILGGRQNLGPSLQSPPPPSGPLAISRQENAAFVSSQQVSQRHTSVAATRAIGSHATVDPSVENFATASAFAAGQGAHLQKLFKDIDASGLPRGDAQPTSSSRTRRIAPPTSAIGGARGSATSRSIKHSSVVPVGGARVQQELAAITEVNTSTHARRATRRARTPTALEQIVRIEGEIKAGGASAELIGQSEQFMKQLLLNNMKAKNPAKYNLLIVRMRDDPGWSFTVDDLGGRGALSGAALDSLDRALSYRLLHARRARKTGAPSLTKKHELAHAIVHGSDNAKEHADHHMAAESAAAQLSEGGVENLSDAMAVDHAIVINSFDNPQERTDAIMQRLPGQKLKMNLKQEKVVRKLVLASEHNKQPAPARVIHHNGHVKASMVVQKAHDVIQEASSVVTPIVVQVLDSVQDMMDSADTTVAASTSAFVEEASKAAIQRDEVDDLSSVKNRHATSLHPLRMDTGHDHTDVVQRMMCNSYNGYFGPLGDDPLQVMHQEMQESRHMFDSATHSALQAQWQEIKREDKALRLIAKKLNAASSSASADVYNGIVHQYINLVKPYDRRVKVMLSALDRHSKKLNPRPMPATVGPRRRLFFAGDKIAHGNGVSTVASQAEDQKVNDVIMTTDGQRVPMSAATHLKSEMQIDAGAMKDEDLSGHVAQVDGKPVAVVGRKENGDLIVKDAAQGIRVVPAKNATRPVAARHIVGNAVQDVKMHMRAMERAQSSGSFIAEGHAITGDIIKFKVGGRGITRFGAVVEDGGDDLRVYIPSTKITVTVPSGDYVVVPRETALQNSALSSYVYGSDNFRGDLVAAFKHAGATLNPRGRGGLAPYMSRHNLSRPIGSTAERSADAIQEVKAGLGPDSDMAMSRSGTAETMSWHSTPSPDPSLIDLAAQHAHAERIRTGDSSPAPPPILSLAAHRRGASPPPPNSLAQHVANKKAGLARLKDLSQDSVQAAGFNNLATIDGNMDALRQKQKELDSRANRTNANRPTMEQMALKAKQKQLAATRAKQVRLQELHTQKEIEVLQGRVASASALVDQQRRQGLGSHRLGESALPSQASLHRRTHMHGAFQAGVLGHKPRALPPQQQAAIDAVLQQAQMQNINTQLGMNRMAQQNASGLAELQRKVQSGFTALQAQNAVKASLKQNESNNVAKAAKPLTEAITTAMGGNPAFSTGGGDANAMHFARGAGGPRQVPRHKVTSPQGFRRPRHYTGPRMSGDGRVRRSPRGQGAQRHSRRNQIASGFLRLRRTRLQRPGVDLRTQLERGYTSDRMRDARNASSKPKNPNVTSSRRGTGYAPINTNPQGPLAFGQAKDAREARAMEGRSRLRPSAKPRRRAHARTPPPGPSYHGVRSPLPDRDYGRRVAASTQQPQTACSE